MIIDGQLYFSPKIFFDDIDIGNQKVFPNQFKDRIIGFYLEPIKYLQDYNASFAAGVILVSCIDALSRYHKDYGEITPHEKRYSKWVADNLPSFKNGYSKRFYTDFRNGLVHEALIKKKGAFSHQIQKPFIFSDNSLVVNPFLIAEEVFEALNYFKTRLENEIPLWKYFNKKIKRDLEDNL